MEKQFQKITGEEFFTLPSSELMKRLSENYTSVFNENTGTIEWVFKGEESDDSKTLEEEVAEFSRKENRYVRQGEIGSVAIILALLVIAAISFAFLIN